MASREQYRKPSMKTMSEAQWAVVVVKLRGMTAGTEEAAGTWGRAGLTG